MKRVQCSGLGLMSGSSLDGLDIAGVHFALEYEPAPTPTLHKVEWSLACAQTFSYTETWRKRLKYLEGQTAFELAKTHVYLGHYFAILVKDFLKSHPFQPDFIASHGHTVFHEPERHLTLQIGDGAALAAQTKITVIDDFRSQDVALDGQGAPLAPLADVWLWPEYDLWLNLGGIANLSARAPEGVLACDITGCNQLLNALAEEEGLPYDADGQLAAQGSLLEDLLQFWNRLPFFTKPFPKSLSNRWVQKELILPALRHSASTADKLRTACEHIAQQVRLSVETLAQTQHPRRMLLTGGGAKNDFLVGRIGEALQSTGVEVCVPDAQIVDFKEAILMAFMGALRLQNIPNCLKSVTGAKRDSVG
ncbi:MAG: anhydro-N-acetylmuramic acid kinase, partial [Bacteroidetes bacterium]